MLFSESKSFFLYSILNDTQGICVCKFHLQNAENSARTNRLASRKWMDPTLTHHDTK